jgi:hypothetical protein
MSDDGPRVPVTVPWILLAGLGAALLVTSLMKGCGARQDSVGDAGFPTEMDGRAVITVDDAKGFQAKDDGSEVVVAGWYQQAAVMACPAPGPGMEPLLEGNCEVFSTFLMRDPESLIKIAPNSMEGTSPSGPSVNVVLDGPGNAWARLLPANGASTPTPVVFIGHFNDPRAERCQGVEQCRDIFVVTQVAWADGVDNP